jgi:hypothetical protein
MDFSNCINFIQRSIDGNPIWEILRRIPPKDDSELNQVHYCYHNDGVELICEVNPDIILNTIYLYPLGFPIDASEQQIIKPFTGKLPAPLRPDMTEADIISELGEPDKAGGDFEDEDLGYQPPWIKYYPKAETQLMIEFADDTIYRINVGKVYF